MLLADYKGYQRLARLKYVPLAGGDVSVLRPYRMALAHICGRPGCRGSPTWHRRGHAPTDERKVLRHQLESGLACVPTSSMGRLFDAVSALAGVRQIVAYEAQAAIELEGMSRDCDCGASAYTFEIDGNQSPAVIDPAAGHRSGRRRRPRRSAAGVIGAQVPPRGGRADGRSRPTGERAHRCTVRRRIPERTAATTLVLRVLRDKGFHVITHRLVPPNDGGIALGQLLVGNSV